MTKLASPGGVVIPRRKQDIRAMLHPQNPYANFDASRYPYDPHGWNGNAPLFARLIEEVDPAIAIEVGSYKGQSAINIAGRMAARREDAQLICVDTWLGSLDWWLTPNSEAFVGMQMQNGYPTVYWQFLANIVHAGLQEVVVPFPATSTIAARWLLLRQVKADLIYIDVSHEENDVYMDIVYYWQTLRPGGVMFGDDYRSDFYPGVVRAVAAFAGEQGLQPEIVDGQFWVLKKPS